VAAAAATAPHPSCPSSARPSPPSASGCAQQSRSTPNPAKHATHAHAHVDASAACALRAVAWRARRHVRACAAPRLELVRGERGGGAADHRFDASLEAAVLLRARAREHGRAGRRRRARERACGAAQQRGGAWRARSAHVRVTRCEIGLCTCVRRTRARCSCAVRAPRCVGSTWRTPARRTP
jgi:hypothetical protein